MQYTVEDISPVKKKLQVTVPAGEVGAALASAVEMYRSNVTLKGFRKGKAPAGLVEQQFRREVYGEATTEIVNKNISSILDETKFVPVSRFDFDSEEVKRDQDFNYSITFEVLPEFDLPAYEGLEVEQEEAAASEEQIDSAIERLRGQAAQPEPVVEDRAAADNDVVSVDFEGRDEKGEILEAVTGKDFTITLGEGQTLDDFENIIKSLKKGETGEGPMSFPEDYFSKDFAGRTVNLKITLNSISEKKLPEVDDAFAHKVAGMSTVEELRRNIGESQMKSRTNSNKAVAKQKLLEKMMEGAEFPVPEVMLDSNVEMMLNNMRQTLAQMQQADGLDSLGSEEELREEVLPDATRRTREQILLISIARKHELEVSDQEAEMQIRRMAMQSGQDPNAVLDYYQRNNFMPTLKERLMEDKALDYIYDHAVVSMVAPKPAAEKAEDEAGAGDDKSKKKTAKQSEEPSAEAPAAGASPEDAGAADE